ncbi:copper amine oxidase N-terminal domain-containing protein [Paenibacillus terrigena]|uniref:copper amine oxidase N-terminal domain-containing protein n=1 Tax=Paenibacillus terrigena TaxID=369333 RepID=UPI000374457A|nr:copper amine oxidase N-terminal domain-containing protein [Paenibacillus terrigena]
MKKVTSALLVMCLAFLFSSMPIHAESIIKLIINSEIINSDSPPMVINGSTMVSLDSLRKLNLNLDWNSKNKTVTVTTKVNKDKLILKVGEKEATFRDIKIPLESPVQLRKNRVMVPLRFISEAFKSDVRWIKETNTIVIRCSDKIDTYSMLYQGDDLVAARKIAVSLPIIGENKLSSSSEMSSHQLYFPEGEVLHYYHVWGNLLSYYEVNNDVSYLVWEGVESQPGNYSKENGKRPAPEKLEVYFDLARDSKDVAYGRVNSGEVLRGKSDDSGANFLSGMIQSIPDETRTDKVSK